MDQLERTKRVDRRRFGGQAAVYPGPADIQGLLAALGIVPIGLYDARYGATGTSPVTAWADARGGSYPGLTKQAGTPVLSGSGATVSIQFPSTAYMTSAAQPLPASGLSIIAVGNNNGGGGSVAGPQAYCAALPFTLNITSQSGDYGADVFTTAAHNVVTSVASTAATSRVLCAAYLYTGTGYAQVDAQSQVTGSVPAVTPGANTFVMYTTALAGTWNLQGLLFLPGVYTAPQLSAVATWAAANHTFTAA